jgi:curli biogenesis system outer membrane secretion channel CsgG
MKHGFLIRHIFFSIPICILFSCVSVSGEKKAGIDRVIALSMGALSANIKNESKIAVLDIQEIRYIDWQPRQTGRSEYILDLLTKKLVDSHRFVIMDRTSFETKKMGQYFLSPGEITDVWAISAGKLLRADVVITGVITGSSGVDYLRIKAIEVGTGQILCMTYEAIIPVVYTTNQPRR